MEAGRFVLLTDESAYVTSWDTWEECSVAFPIEPGHFLFDQETARQWLPGSKYEWEDART